MTFRKDNAPHSGGNGGREKQGHETDASMIPDPATKLQGLAGWFALAKPARSRLEAEARRKASFRRKAAPTTTTTAAGPLYVLPEQPIRGSRK
jgi:hypothetical protein